MVQEMQVLLLRCSHLEPSSPGSSMCPLWIRTHSGHLLGITLALQGVPHGPEGHLIPRSSPFPACLKGPLVWLRPRQGSDCVCVPHRSGAMLWS